MNICSLKWLLSWGSSISRCVHMLCVYVCARVCAVSVHVI